MTFVLFVRFLCCYWLYCDRRDSCTGVMCIYEVVLYIYVLFRSTTLKHRAFAFVNKQVGKLCA